MLICKFPYSHKCICCPTLSALIMCPSLVSAYRNTDAEHKHHLFGQRVVEEGFMSIAKGAVWQLMC